MLFENPFLVQSYWLRLNYLWTWLFNVWSDDAGLTRPRNHRPGTFKIIECSRRGLFIGRDRDPFPYRYVLVSIGTTTRESGTVAREP